MLFLEIFSARTVAWQHILSHFWVRTPGYCFCSGFASHSALGIWPGHRLHSPHCSTLFTFSDENPLRPDQFQFFLTDKLRCHRFLFSSIWFRGWYHKDSECFQLKHICYSSKQMLTSSTLLILLSKVNYTNYPILCPINPSFSIRFASEQPNIKYEHQTLADQQMSWFATSSFELRLKCKRGTD